MTRKFIENQNLRGITVIILTKPKAQKKNFGSVMTRIASIENTIFDTHHQSPEMLTLPQPGYIPFIPPGSYFHLHPCREKKLGQNYWMAKNNFLRQNTLIT